MTNILVIAYYFPPLEDSACLRNVAFARHLPEFGFNPLVLSVKNPDLSDCRLALTDDGMPAHLAVFRSRSVLSLNRLVSELDTLLRRILRFIGARWRTHTL